MYYADLELCRYHNGPLDCDSWHVPLRAIGWLERVHPYSRVPTPLGLAAQLEALIDSAESHFQQYHFRGLHDCTLCNAGPEARLARSHINLLIPFTRTVFACPAAISHYISIHSYLPPSEFVEAVQTCPPYGSPQYEVLQAANDGHPVPMITWDQCLAEERTQQEDLIKLRKARLDTGPKK